MQRHRRFQAKAVATTFTSRVDRSRLWNTHEAVRTRAPSLEVGVPSVSQCTRGSEDEEAKYGVDVHCLAPCFHIHTRAVNITKIRMSGMCTVV